MTIKSIVVAAVIAFTSLSAQAMSANDVCAKAFVIGVNEEGYLHADNAKTRANGTYSGDKKKAMCEVNAYGKHEVVTTYMVVNVRTGTADSFNQVIINR